MQSTVLLALGSYRFAVSTGAYQSLKRKTDWRHPSTERIGMMPGSQFIGPGDDKITIDGVIYPHFRGGLRQIDLMRAQAGMGRAMPLITGYGRYFGMYVIESVVETQTVLMSDGAPRKIEFSIELKDPG